MKFWTPVVLTLLPFVPVKGQMDLNYLKNKVKDKAQEKTEERLSKKQKDFDESNFNYAILFLENSSGFEAKEQGNAFSANLLNTGKFLRNEEKSTVEKAYTNLRNGEILLKGNRYYMAEQSLKLAKFLYEEAGQTHSTNYGQTLSNLALLYQTRGNYTKAQDCSQKALEIRRDQENKGMLLVSLNNDGVLKKSMGQFAEAEDELRSSLQLANERNDHEAKALVLNNLAMNALDMNRVDEAAKYMDQSIAEATLILKTDESNFLKLQTNKASILRIQKKYAEAEGIYVSCISAKEKRLGVHPDLAQLKLGLARLYLEMDRRPEAEKLYQEACEIFKRKLGEKNPATLEATEQLANFYSLNGDFARALELITPVCETKKMVYGENHPSYIQALDDQAIILWQNNRITQARENYRVVINSTLEYINHFFKSLNEHEKTQYWEKTVKRLQKFYAFAFSNHDSDKELAPMIFNTLINTKGFLLNNSSRIKAAILESGDTALISQYRLWLQTRENLNIAFQLSREEQLQEHMNVDSLKESAGQIEKELSRKSALFRQQLSSISNYTQLAKSLRPEEAILEILEVPDYNKGAIQGDKYAALLLRSDELHLLELGDALTIENAIKTFRDKIIHTKPEAEGYQVLWKPLESKMQGITRVFVSPDGAYHKLSFNALRDPAGKYLADKFEIILVGNSADVLAIKESEKTKTKPAKAVLFGNPLYGNKGLVQQLDGTELEVKNIAALLTKLGVKTRSVLGPEATETAVKDLRSPDILHIATHGYFLDDISKREGSRVIGVDIKAASENPLLRSGLLLAGCENVYEENYRPSLLGENGVLTAYEAMNLDLEKTDLVVLSACETGLGSIRQGEGVYGLQRAFLIAGAKSIIMSLWSVSDDATMELMTLFYTNYAKSGDKAHAFAEAIKQLKLKYKQPFYWSAFVMLSR